MLRALPPVRLTEVFLSLFFLLALLAAAEVVSAMINYLMFGCVAVVDCTYNLYCRLLIRVIRLVSKKRASAVGLLFLAMQLQW
jgi:hypothetical protein